MNRPVWVMELFAEMIGGMRWIFVVPPEICSRLCDSLFLRLARCWCHSIVLRQRCCYPSGRRLRIDPQRRVRLRFRNRHGLDRYRSHLWRTLYVSVPYFRLLSADLCAAVSPGYTLAFVIFKGFPLRYALSAPHTFRTSH